MAQRANDLREVDTTAYPPAPDASAPRQVVAVPLTSLRPGNSPRLQGQDRAHVARLAEIDGPLPPILVDWRTMRVIDGMHRLLAAMANGQETINVQYYEGSESDAFLRAVEANATHGLPLSLADRRAAAAKIVRSHPHMSDRSIGTLAGLSNKTVAAIRRTADPGPQLHSRVGRDGRVRPLNGARGRERAAALLARYPDASLRDVARDAGVSPGTVRDIRRRLQDGGDPVPSPARQPQAPVQGSTPAPAPATLLERLLRDPSLRYNEQGRRLLGVLQLNTVMADEWNSVMSAVPSHCAPMVAQLARQYATMWLSFAHELHEHPAGLDHLTNRDASS